MSTLHLHFLGPVRFEHDGGPVEITAAKSVALLAFLAANRESQARERLLGLLWGNSAEDAARKNLRNTLWGIGKAFGDHIVRSDEEHLALDEDVRADVREFERIEGPLPPAELRTTLDLYDGEFLAHFSLSDSPEFEIWLASERERLAQLFLHGIATLIQSERAMGRWEQVKSLAQRGLAQDNLQEPLHRALIEAYGRLDERTEALRQYETLRGILREELGVEPLPETRAVRDAIAEGALERRTILVDESVPVRLARSTPGRLPFVGRQKEREALDAGLRRALDNRAAAVLLTGEVGIGKSRLWEEWCSGLPAGAAALEGRCLEATQALPFAPLAELFGNRLFYERVFVPGSPVARIWLAEVTRLLPDLRTVLPDLPAPATVPPEEERRRVFEAFTQCLLALHARPLVLFLDDLHWADHATIEWLDYLVHRLEDQPLLLVAAFRPEDAPARLVQMAARWGREGLARRVPLVRLNEDEAGELMNAVSGKANDAARKQSGGNPYFLIELARAGGDEVPSVLADLIRARLDRLPETARQVLQAAAMLEPDFDFASLRRTSGRGEEETLDALDELLSNDVLTEREGIYNFVHPLVAEVVREGLGGARRSFLNRRAAQALEETHAGRLAPVAGRLAEYYEQAGEPARAAGYADMAAAHALALAAPEEAIAFYRRALALEPTPAREMGLGRALLRQVELAEARAAYERARKAYEASGDRRGMARASMSIAETLFPSARFDEAQEWMDRAFHALEGDSDPESRVLLYLLRGSSAAHAFDPEGDAAETLERAADLAVANDLPVIGAQASFIRGNLLAEQGHLSAAVNAYGRTIELAHAGGDDFQQVLGHNNAAYHELLLGHLDEAHSHIEAGLKIAETRALRLPLQHLYSTRGEIALAEKKWDEAEDWFKRGLVEAEQNHNRREQANYRANLGLAARGRGDLDGAVMLLEAARSEAGELPEPHLQAKIDLHLAELYLERGERAAAAEALSRAEARLKGTERKGLIDWAKRIRGSLKKR